MVVRILATALVWLVVVGCTRATEPSPADTAEEEAVIDARRLFQRKCASCHGSTGRGDGPAASMLRPADLTSAEVGDRLTAEHVDSVIRNGLGNMPRVANLTDAEVAALAEFVLLLDE